MKTAHGPYVLARLTVLEVSARDAVTAVRSPVLVIGDTTWLRLRYGDTVRASGRLRPASISTSNRGEPFTGGRWGLIARHRAQERLRHSRPGLCHGYIAASRHRSGCTERSRGLSTAQHRSSAPSFRRTWSLSCWKVGSTARNPTR